MTTLSSRVGGMTIPVPAGTLNETFHDPTLEGLASFLGFMLRDGLNAKLANMQGTTADALPSGSTYHYDPATWFVRNAIPGLYLWWPGKEERRPWTLLYDVIVREVLALYVFQELPAPGGLEPRHGLIPAVNAVFTRAAEMGYHPSFALGSDPLGTPIYQSMGIKGWTYLGGEPGFLMGIAPESAVEGLGDYDGMIERGYPALRARFSVFEAVTAPGGPVSPDDDNVTVDLGLHATDIAPLSNAPLVRRKTAAV
jgi:hypothetical protein